MLQTIIFIWLGTLLVPLTMIVASCFKPSRDLFERFIERVETRIRVPMLLLGGMLLRAVYVIFCALVFVASPRRSWKKLRKERRMKKENPEQYALLERAWRDVL